MKKTALLLSMFAVAACRGAVGPDYHRPALNVPARWAETRANVESDGPALEVWWKTFNDPELDSLIDRAIRSNLDLRMAEARVREARARYGIAAGALGPSAAASGSYAREQASRRQPVLRSLPVPSSVPFENDVYRAGIDASWEIDLFGGKHREAEAARAEFAAVECQRRGVVLALLGEVGRNYVEVRGLQRRLAIARLNIAAQERAVAIIRDRQAHGVAADLDLEEASSLLETTQAEIPALEAALRADLHRMGVLLGESPDALLAELSRPAPVPAAPASVPVGLPSDLLLRRPDVEQAERELAAATARIGVAKSDLFPKFSLTGAAGFESISAGDWFRPGSGFWSIGPSIRWRIFDSGRIRANIRVQNARQEEALAAYEKTVLNAFQEVETRLAAYADERIRHRSLRDAAGSAQQALDVADRLYAAGLSDFLQVLDAERSLYAAQDRLAGSDQAISADLVALYASLGGGWDAARPGAIGS